MIQKQNRKIWMGALLAILIPLAVVLFSLRVWEMDLNVPLDFNQDSMLGLTIVKSMCENGLKGLFICESLGAPEISVLVETPFLDLDFAFEVLALNLVVNSPMVIYYCIYFLTFVLSGLTMYLLLNHLTNKVWMNVFFSVAYAITPYHFFRWMGHMTLSNYYVIPLAIYLTVLIAEEEFAGVVPSRYTKSKWKGILMYVACIIVGWGNVYYAFFGLMCMGVAFLVKLIKTKRIQCLWKEAIPIYVTGGSVFVSLLPKIIYTLQNGVNEQAAVRSGVESEVYALKIIQMLLPNSGNRIPFLSNITQRYAANAVLINENSSASLGLIATIGFCVACVWLIFRVVNAVGTRNLIFNERMNLFSLLILILVLYCVGGGFGSIVAYCIMPEIRALNRSSIVIVCLAVSICCMGMEYLQAMFTQKKHKVYTFVAFGLVGIFVLYSEVTYFQSGWRQQAQEQDQVLREFFDEVEASLEENAMIYQLPFMTFPEGGSVVNMGEYEHSLGYVYTEGLKWSYGAMKGRHFASQSLYVDEGMSKSFVDGIIEAGFSAVYIDTRGFEDGGESINKFYQGEMGLTPIASEDGWLYLYLLKKGE